MRSRKRLVMKPPRPRILLPCVDDYYDDYNDDKKMRMKTTVMKLDEE